MGNLRFNVFIDGAHKIGQKDFVHGKIMGYIESICVSGTRRSYLRRMGDCIGVVIPVEASPDEYVRLKNIIEEHYPGLCRFAITNIAENDK